MAILDIPRTEQGAQPWFIRRALDLSSAVGRVTVGAGSGMGSGFLIAPHLLLTCHSVLPNPETAQQSSVAFDYHCDEDGHFRDVTMLHLAPRRAFFSHEALNFTLVALDPAANGRAVIPLAAGMEATVGDQVSLFHHPRGGPLHLALRSGEVLASYQDFIHHTCNTEPGSGGGPLLDESLRLIGVHHASVVRDSDRARTTRSPAHGPFVANEAIHVQAILSELKRQAPELLQGVMGAQQEEIVARPMDETPMARPSAPDVVQMGAPTARDAVFISYAHADQGKRMWRDKLRTFLAPFRTRLDVWDDSRIETGAQWRMEIDYALKRARVAVLLVGPGFLGSEFIANDELPPLLQAAQAEGVVILPLITNHCSYSKTALGRYQAFNDPDRPLEALATAEQHRYLRLFAEKIDEAFQRAARG